MIETATREVIFGKKEPKKTSSTEFKRSLAIVIGIDCYSNGIPPLTTAVNDASRLARILETQHGYSVTLLTEDVTKSRIEAVFKEQKNNLSENDRLLFYFAGHGVASDCDKGPEGYLIPQDADQKDEKTFWKMTELHEALETLSCRHLLAILDCCFAGAFRWSSKRDFQPLPSVMHRERYERFLRSWAWQVVTSAAHNQKALDVLCGNVVGERGQKESQHHSPFALSLFEALKGAADLQNDGVVTATELYLYLRDQVEVSAEQLASHQQTPGLWPLNKHRHGEFIFLVPGGTVKLDKAPDLIKENNPYKGLSSYEKGDSKLFFGRKSLIKKLRQVVEEQPFTAVLGASGTGKSSLVKAGLLPALENNTKEPAEQGSATQASPWFILEKEGERDDEKKKRVMRPGANPLSTLRSLLIKELPGVRPEREEGSTAAGLIWQWHKKNQGQKLLLVIDQFEELITSCREEQARKDFIRELMQALEEHSEVLRLVLTLRSDFEAQISQTDLKKYWQDKNRFVVPPMTQDELREVIEEPASDRVLYFEPHELIDRLINEVIQTPGALPLLSFTLSELYLRYVARQKDIEQEEGDRALTEADYEEIGGVIGSLRRRIDQEYESLDDEHKATMRRILLRMVAFEGGGLTRRRVPKRELEYPDAEENKRVKLVVAQLSQARLIVAGSSEKAGGGLEEDVEPAHDALIVAWDKLLQWQKDEAENMLLHRQLTRAAADWEDSAGAKDRDGLLWDNSPRLLRAQEILEQKWSRSRAVPTAGQKSFRGLRQFWRVLFPTFKHLEQHIWLNRVETDFVRRSVEKKRNWTRRVSGIVVIVMAVLAIAWWKTNDALIKTEQKRLESNYNLAKVFEEKATTELKSANGLGDEQYKKAIIFASAALEQDIKLSKSALKAASTGILFDSAVFRASLASMTVFQENENNIPKNIFIPDKKSIYLIKLNDINTAKLWFYVYNDIEFLGNKTYEYTFNRSKYSYSQYFRKSVSLSGDDVLLSNANSSERIFLNGHTNGGTKVDSSIDSVAFSPDGRRIVATSWNTVLLWDAESGKELAVFKGDAPKRAYDDVGITNVAFSYNGSSIASASYDTVRLWDISSRKELAVLNHKGKIDSITFSPDDSTVVSASNDYIRLWDAKSGKELAVFKGNKNHITDLAFSSDGRHIAAFSWKNTIQILDVASSKESPGIKINGYNMAIATFDNMIDSIDGVLGRSNNGSVVASILSKNIFRLNDVSSGKELAIFKGHDGHVNGVSFSPTGEIIASFSDDKTVRIWNSAGGNELVVFRNHEKEVVKAAFSPDGKTIVSASRDQTAILWDVATGKELSTFKLHNTEKMPVFSPDGILIAYISENNIVRLFKVASGKELAMFSLKDHLSGLLIFSHDSKIINYLPDFSNSDETIKICEIRLLNLFLHDTKPTSLYFTFIEAVKFLWQLDVQGIEIVHKERTPEDMAKFGSLLAPPPAGQNKFDQVLEWAEKQQASNPTN